MEHGIIFTLMTAEKPLVPSEHKQLAHRTMFLELSSRIISTPGNADTEQSLQ